MTLTTAEAASAPPTVPSSGPRIVNTDELTERRAAVKAQELENFYAEMARQDQERATAEAAAAQQRRPAVSTTANVTAPDPEPEPVAPVDSGDAEAAVSAWFPDPFSQAWGVSGCESGHDPGAISPGGGNWGLFQINTVHKKSFTNVTGQPWSSVLNANYNAQFARWLYDSSGWGPWTCKWAAY